MTRLLPRPAALLFSGLLLCATGAARAQDDSIDDQPAASTGISQLDLQRPRAVNELNGHLSRLAENPRDVDALVGAGEAALELDDPRAATGFFVRADEIASGNGRIKAGLGRAMLKMQNPTEALRLFDQAVRLGYPDTGFLPDRGLARDLTGDQAGAQRDYAAALRTAPNDAEILRRYAVSLGISGQVEAADKVLQPLLYKGDRAAWRDRAFIFAMNGRRDQARDVTTRTMPPRLATAIQPYMDRMQGLTAPQRAAAVHFGNFPAEAATRAAAPPVPAPAAPAAAPAQVADASTAKKPPKRSRREERARAEAAQKAAAAAAAQARQAERAAAALMERAPAPVQTAPVQTAPVQTAQAAPKPVVQPLPSRPAPVTPAPSTPSTAPHQTASAPAASTPLPASRPVQGPPASVPSSRPASPSPTPVRSATAQGAPAQANPTQANPPQMPPTQAAAAAQGVPTATPVGPAAAAAAPTPSAGAPTQLTSAASRTLADIMRELEVPESERRSSVTGVSLAELNAIQAQKQAARQAAAEKAKKDAAAKAKAEADAKAKAEKDRLAKNPSRSWVQVGTGRDISALAFTMKGLRKSYASLAERDAWTASWGRTNRLLVGPFASFEKAKAYEERLKKGGADAFAWKSDAGEDIARLKGE